MTSQRAVETVLEYVLTHIGGIHDLQKAVEYRSTSRNPAV